MLRLRTPVAIMLSDLSPEGMRRKENNEGPLDYDVVNCNKGTVLFTGEGFDCLKWVKRRFWLELQHPKPGEQL